MRGLVQRCRSASVRIDDVAVGGFDGPGLVLFVGVTHSDTPAHAVRLADKVLDLRIFDPPTVGAPEVSAADLGLPVLVVSQFTLYADVRKGRRPTWDAAAPAATAEPLVAAVVERLLARSVDVGCGVFGADMQVHLVNDGPMTIVIDIP